MVLRVYVRYCIDRDSPGRKVLPGNYFCKQLATSIPLPYQLQTDTRRFLMEKPLPTYLEFYKQCTSYIKRKRTVSPNNSKVYYLLKEQYK